MRKLLLITTLLLTVFNLYAEKVNFKKSPLTLGSNDKLAIVLVHFGSTNSNAKATYNAINNMVTKEFKNADLFEAYTSRIVIGLLDKKGINKQTPLELFNELAQKGYTHMVVQSTHIIDGVEMESLREDVRAAKDKFKEIRVGNPLLYNANDFKRVSKAMVSKVKSNSDAVVLVGHGTYTPITSTYAMMDYILKYDGYNNWYVTTIEGYPTIDETLNLLAKGKYKSVTLAPFMYIAGVHAKEDISGDWKEALEENGYKVELFLEGLGDNIEVQKLIIEHIKFAFENRHLNIMEKKREYASTK